MLPSSLGGCGTSHRVTAGAEEPATHTRTHSYTRKATVTLRPLSEENKRREDRQRKRGQNPTLTSPAGLSAKRLRQGPAPDRCPARRTAGEGASIIPSGPYGCPQCHQCHRGRGWVQRGKWCAEPTVAHRTPRVPKFSAGSVDRCNGAATGPLVHSLKPSCPQGSPTHVCCHRMAGKRLRSLERRMDARSLPPGAAEPGWHQPAASPCPALWCHRR